MAPIPPHGQHSHPEEVDPSDWTSYRIYMVRSVEELKNNDRSMAEEISKLKVEAAKTGAIYGIVASIAMFVIEQAILAAFFHH